MSRPPSFALHISEDTESDGQDLSPDNEGALHTSFCQLIQEQSSLLEAGLELEMQERGQEHPSCLAPPDACAIMARLEPGQGEQHPHYSSTSLQILASMPSRTIGRSRGAIISQYYNRTAQLRRRNSRPPLQQLCRTARPSLRQYDLETDPARARLEDKRSLLVKEMLSLPPTKCSHMLLNMPLSLAEKCTLWQELSRQRGTLRQRTQHRTSSSSSLCWWSMDYIILGCRSLWYRLSQLPAVQPWHYTLKQISGRFGSSVLSYFLFLKKLLMFNVLFLLLLLFVVAPQAAYPPASANPQPFTGLELLTGTGYFTNSLLYYGYYRNGTLNEPYVSGSNSSIGPLAAPPLPYNMPLAYLFSIGASFLITCVLLVYSMYCSFRESYRLGSSVKNLAIKVFCAWDFKVMQRRSVKLQCENICTQLKELLAERRSRSSSLSPWNTVVLFLAWFLSLGTVVLCVLAVHHFSEHMHMIQQDHRVQGSSEWQQEAILLALPFVVSLLNVLMPYLYNLLAMCERQESPVMQVYVAVSRHLILKMVILGLLCYQWLRRKVVCSTDECWETCVGQELYRFVVMDFIFTLLDTLFRELVWRLILEKRLKRKQRPEFDIARNVLELIYGQTLTWLGVFFAPLLPVMQVLKLLLLFYIKKTSLMQNCQSPSKPWQACHMNTVFITLLCFPSFLGAAIFLSYTIWSMQPSETCGPFQGLETIYKSGQTWMQLLEKSNPDITWFVRVYQHLLQSPALLLFMSAILLVLIYVKIQMVKGQRRIIRLLREQIIKEGKDKSFLINKLHSVYEQRERRA